MSESSPEYDSSRFDDRNVAQGDGWEVVVTQHGQVSIYVDEPVSTATAVTIAHAILSEVEILTRDASTYIREAAGADGTLRDM